MDIYTIRNKEPLDVLIFSSVDGGFIYAFRFWTVIIYKKVLRLIRKFVDEIINVRMVRRRLKWMLFVGFIVSLNPLTNYSFKSQN